MNATFAASSGIEGLDGGGTLKHPVFGEAVTEHAIFTVWSMRKIGNLIEQIFQAPELKSQSLEDKEFCKRYTYHAIRAFGRGSAWTACILLSGIIVRCRQTWLNTSATGCARQSIRMLGAGQGLDLRRPAQESLDVKVDWDEEDQELLDAAMSDDTQLEQ